MRHGSLAVAVLVALPACGGAPTPPPVTTAIDAAAPVAEPRAPSPPDAAPPSRTSDAAAPDTAAPDDGTCKGALVCDDFESNAVGRTPAGWAASVGAAAGTMRVDDMRAFSGTKAVHVTTPAGARGQAFFGRALPALPDDAFYGRMMIWVSATPPMGVHWDNIRGSGKLPGTDQQVTYNYGGGGSGNMMANYYTTGSDCWKNSKSALPTQRWACVAWHYDGTRNQMEYWLDGKPITDLTVVGKGDGCTGTNLWRAPTFDRLSLGWYNAQTTPITVEMWIDDVAVDTQPIGCPPAR